MRDTEKLQVTFLYYFHPPQKPFSFLETGELVAAYEKRFFFFFFFPLNGHRKEEEKTS